MNELAQTYSIEEISTKTNSSTLKVNGFFLHSKYNPEKEAEQFAEKNYAENYLHILFGYGLGYFAKALQRKFQENDRLLIIDPLFNDHEHNYEISEIPVFCNIDKKQLEIEINRTLTNFNVNVKMICSPNYDKIFPEKYKTVLNTVQEVLRTNTLYRNTVNFFAESWQENYVRNLLYVSKDESLSMLEKRFDLPVVVASGGPSLSKQIPKLKEVRNKVILIASGSTINTLLHYNIEPDFVVSIDGGEVNYNHFKDHIFTQTYFIYSIRNHYKIREQFTNKAFSFMPSIEPEVQQHIEKISQKSLPMLIGGTSVANYALTIALYMSTGKIALIGQDLAYTDNKTHAEHNKHFQEVTADYKKERGVFFTEGYNGDEVLTDSPFFSMKKSFEQIAEISKDEDRLFNCTEGGAKIEQFRQISFNEFCADLTNINLGLNLNLKDTEIDMKEFINRIDDEIITYQKLVELLEKATKLLVGNKSSLSFSTKIIKGLDKVDKEIKKIFETVSMNAIVDPIILDTLSYFLPKQNESKKEEFDRVFSQSKQLYIRLLSAAKLSKEYTENLLDEVTKKIKDENNDTIT